MNKELAEKLWEIKEYLAKGKRGFVYVSEFDNNKYLIKTSNPDSQKTNSILFEAMFNEKLNKINVGPKFFFYDKENDFVVREFIQGENLFEWFKENKNKSDFKHRVQNILINILDQARKMDLAGINKMEMTSPHKDILIDKNDKPFIIDFERCKEAIKSKNVTQFCQFIANGKFNFDLKDAGLNVDSTKLIELATKYKQEDYPQERFKEIKREIKDF